MQISDLDSFLGYRMSYMDQNGFKWKLQDPLGGLSGDRIQYREGNGWDGFGMNYEQDFLFQMSGSQLTPSFQNGVAGFSFWYSVPGAEGKGYTLNEVRWDKGFIGNGQQGGNGLQAASSPDLKAPRKLKEDIDGRKWNVQEEANRPAAVHGSQLLRDQHQVIVMDPDVVTRIGSFGNRFCEDTVGFLIRLPVGRLEVATRGQIVKKGPEDLVGESVVVAFDDLIR